MGKGGGGGGVPAKQTTTTKAIPFLESDITDAAAKAREFFNSPESLLQFFPGSTVAGFTPEQEQALTNITNLASSESPLATSASDLLQRTLQGEFLRGSPELDAVIASTSADIGRQFNNTVIPGLNASFALSGGPNSSARGLAFGDAARGFQQELGNTIGQIRLGNLVSERNLQQGALGLAPAIESLRFQPARELFAAGGARQALEQARIGEDINRFNFNQGAPGQQLDDYLNRLALLSGVAGTGTSSTALTSGTGGSGLSPLGGIAGGLGGLGIGGSIASQFPGLFAQGTHPALIATLARTGGEVVAPGALAGIGAGPFALGLGALGLLGGLVG